MISVENMLSWGGKPRAGHRHWKDRTVSGIYIVDVQLVFAESINKHQSKIFVYQQAQF